MKYKLYTDYFRDQLHIYKTTMLCLFLLFSKKKINLFWFLNLLGLNVQLNIRNKISITTNKRYYMYILFLRRLINSLQKFLKLFNLK